MLNYKKTFCDPFSVRSSSACTRHPAHFQTGYLWLGRDVPVRISVDGYLFGHPIPIFISTREPSISVAAGYVRISMDIQNVQNAQMHQERRCSVSPLSPAGQARGCAAARRGGMPVTPSAAGQHRLRHALVRGAAGRGRQVRKWWWLHACRPFYLPFG